MHYSAVMNAERRQAPAGSSVGEPDSLLGALGLRVRGLREQRGWTRAELAERSGLSVRFIARIEGGDGNVSVVRLDALARALGRGADELLRPAADPRRVVALVGLRGAGKSSVGPLVAERLGRPFVEMDRLIVEAAGLPLEQLFELHGERYYRRLERETLRQVLGGDRAVVLAAAGGVVNDPLTWRMLRRGATLVWLRAAPEEHWSRVLAQGDRRPMRDHPHAMAELRSLLDARAPVYGESDVTVDTSGLDPTGVAAEVARRLG